MKSRELFHQSNFDTQYYTITYFDQIGDIRFRDMDREYLLNVTSNLALDYMESILGYDLTWIQSINQVADLTDDAEVSHNKVISLCVCPSLVHIYINDQLFRLSEHTTGKSLSYLLVHLLSLPLDRKD